MLFSMWKMSEELQCLAWWELISHERHRNISGIALPANGISHLKLKQTKRQREKDTITITAERKNCFRFSLRKNALLEKLLVCHRLWSWQKKKKTALPAVICSLCKNSRRRSQSLKAYVSFHSASFADCTVGLTSRETKGPSKSFLLRVAVSE